jgi:hypothetical protein
MEFAIMNFSTIRLLNARAIGFALFALAMAALSTAGRAEERAPPAVVEVASAATARLAPARWVPGSVISRDDAKIASADASNSSRKSALA